MREVWGWLLACCRLAIEAKREIDKGESLQCLALIPGRELNQKCGRATSKRQVHPAARAMADGLAAALMDLGRLPRRACTPDHRPGRHQLRCRWGVPPLGVGATLWLVEAGHDRYAVGWWAGGPWTSGAGATSRRSPTPSRPADPDGRSPPGAWRPRPDRRAVNARVPGSRAGLPRRRGCPGPCLHGSRRPPGRHRSGGPRWRSVAAVIRRGVTAPARRERPRGSAA
jgi:hypothetical protein